MQVASMPLGLVSTKVLLVSCSTHSAKLLFFQKTSIVCIEDCEEWREGVYAQNKLNIRANVPFELLPQSSVQIGGGRHIYGTLQYYLKAMLHVYCTQLCIAYQ